MPVSRILSRLAFSTGLSRKSHRRRFARSFSPGLVRLEQLEQKVLLSATTIDDTTADVIVDAMESPSVDQSANYDDYADSYSDVDYYETVLSSPVGEDYGDYADEYYAQETAALDAVAESYEAGATDTQPHMPNSTTDEDADDEDTINDDLVNDTTQRLDEVVPGADRDADDDEGDQSPAVPTPSPFEFPSEVVTAFEPLTPPIQETSDNLFLVQPDGTESFETVITTQSAVTADATDDEHAPQSLPTTDLEREVTLQQTWNDTDDWTIHQSVTNRFDRESKTTDEEGDDQNIGRSGSETISVTVINGTTTVTSWSISNTQTFRTGTIPGQQDDDTFGIPEEWITAAATSVNKEDEEATDDDPVDKPPGDKNVADEDQTAVPQQEDESGSSIRTTNDLSVTTTQTLITLPDGAQGMTITSTVGWSASFTWKDGGRFSSDESDLPEGFPDELSGMTLNSTFRYNAYVTASIATSFAVTATVPLLSDGVPDLTDAEFETAFGFAVSGMAGGSSKATTKADLETRTGDEADDTDERLIVRVDDQQAASGSMGFSFYIISGSEELSNQSTDDGPAPSAVQYSPDETAGETNNPTDPKTDKDEDATDGGSDSPDDTGRDSNDDRPRAGSASAGELLAGEAPGVQFTFDANSSSSDTKSHTFEEKTRSATADYRTFTETTLTETTETTSDGGFGVAVGTQENSFRISSSGSDSEEVNSSLTWWQDGYDSSNDPHGDDDGYGSEVWEVSTFDGTFESDYDFEISVGGSSGATFTNDSSFFVEWTETEKISDIPEETGEESGYLTTTAYRNGSAGDIERIDRRSTEFFSPDGNFEFIAYDQVPAVPESDSPGSQDAPLSEREQSEENSAGDSDSQRRCESAHDGTGTTAGNNETAAFAPHENGGTTTEQSGDTDGVWEKRDPTTAIPAPNIPDNIPPLPQEHNCGSVSAMTEQEEAQWDWETKAKEILDSGRPSSHLELALHYEHRGLFYFGPGGVLELSIFNGGISLATLPECQVRFPVAPKGTQGAFRNSVEFDTSSLTGGTGFRYKVFQRSDIDWSMVRTTGARQGRGLTNAEAAARHGLGPILPDGKVATLHHSQQSAIGPLFEASTRYHHIGNAQRAPLHPFGRAQHPHHPLGRGAGSLREQFQRVDSPEYWKWRGQQEL